MRHYSAEDQQATRASEARRIRAIGAGAGTLTFASLTALVIVTAVDNAPSVHADELPQPPKVSEPVQPAPGPVRPIFDFADVQPWDPGKNGDGVVVATQPVTTSYKATRIATSSPVPTERPRSGVVVPVERDQVPSQEETPPPPKDDPLTDDGEFGDGCEQPGTRERCDPGPVGLPPVVVEQPPTETQPAETEPPAEEPPVTVDQPPAVIEPQASTERRGRRGHR